MTSDPAPAVLIYDESCPLCTGAARWVRNNAIPGAVETLPCQDPARAERFPEIEEERCMEAVQLVLPDGTRYEAEQVLPPLFRRLRRWRWLAAVFRVPGVALIAPRVYSWVARHRHELSVLAARKHVHQSEE